MSLSDSDTKQAMNAQHSPLLSKLPGELRNDIYTRVLVSSDGIDITIDAPKKKVDLKERTALLKVSRQIRQEAEVIFYRSTLR